MDSQPVRGTRVNSPRPLSSLQIRSFQEKVYIFFASEGRDLPWRKNPNPYRVLVSEIMLQQTQADRVVEKYQKFLTTFRDFPSLAKAPLKRLLSLWQGLGYNRRALALRAIAQIVVSRHQGRLPSNPADLIALPGIGKYTAGAIAAFAFNKPVVFMDTNIRRVFIHEFFGNRRNIRDEEIFRLIEQTMDTVNPRKWYNALMDYGVMLKKECGNPNRKSAHYTRQSPFDNSNRQVRGAILRILVNGSPLSRPEIVKKSGMDAERVRKNLVDLEKEGFIRRKGRIYVV